MVLFMSMFIKKDELIIVSYSNIRNNNKYIIYGDVNEVCDYFKKYFKNVFIIEQPMPGEKLLNVSYINTNVKNGIILNHLNKFIGYFLLNKLNRNKTSFLLKVRDFCSVINYLIMNTTVGSKYFLAVESVNCLALIIYRIMFKKNFQIIYFCNDYVPNRYGIFYNKL